MVESCGSMASSLLTFKCAATSDVSEVVNGSDERGSVEVIVSGVTHVDYSNVTEGALLRFVLFCVG